MAKFDPFLSCAFPSNLAQSEERKGSNFAIWQPCAKVHDLVKRYCTPTNGAVLVIVDAKPNNIGLPTEAYR